jgi:arylsulfatase A-like enzyme
MKPNIIFIFADQLRSHSLGCYGNHQVSTPHIDRLAK